MEIVWRAPGPVARDFYASNGEGDLPIDVIMGPVGSGKTVACVMRLLRHAMEAPPGPDGWRRTRYAVVRNTGPMLDTTTIPSVLEWLPERVFGIFSSAPPRAYEIEIPSMKVASTWWFVPVDRPEDVRKLLSLNITGAWINELREIDRSIVVELRRRCGRWPPAPQGAPRPWAGIIADTNAPESEHHYLAWWAGLADPPDWLPPDERAAAIRPPGIRFYIQPPAVRAIRGEGGYIERFEPNPDAENVQNLPPGYYLAQIPGAPIARTLNMLCCEIERAGDSRPVHGQFRRAVHVIDDIRPHPNTTVFVGMDFGRRPAAVLCQRIDGRLLVIRECIGDNISVDRFAREVVMPRITELFGDVPIRGWGDPAGEHRTGADDSTAFRFVREAGLPLVRAPSQDPALRQGALERYLQRMIDGKPAIRISASGCPTLIAGLAGGYRFRDQDPDKVEKNIYSHVCEALEYLCLGLERGGGQRPTPANGKVDYDPLRRTRGRLMLERGLP